MARLNKQTILLFIDGLGWGESDPALNPQYVYGGEFFKLPTCEEGQIVSIAAGGLAKPIDAVLGIDGVPQSATGQTTLLSGTNAQAVLGKHLTGFPNEALREILLEKSILKTLTDHRLRARFINAFRPIFFEISRERQLTLSATTVANLAAGLPFFTLDDIREERSIYQEFTNQELIGKGFAVPTRTPAEAGAIMARQALKNDFTLFEYFQTDRAGHAMNSAGSCEQLRRLDEFLTSLLAELASSVAAEMLVVLTSDHGNIEDLSTKRHTLNPVPLMVWGAGGAEFLAQVDRLDEVGGAILKRHGIF